MVEDRAKLGLGEKGQTDRRPVGFEDLLVEVVEVLEGKLGGRLFDRPQVRTQVRSLLYAGHLS